MDHTSFLNNLLMVREQEIRMLSKKLYHQAALDSDGGSGESLMQYSAAKQTYMLTSGY